MSRREYWSVVALAVVAGLVDGVASSFFLSHTDKKIKE